MGSCILRILLCLYFCGFAVIQGKHASIKLKDGHRQQLRACVFPNQLPVTIYIEDMTLEINLMVNNQLSTQIPVYTMTEGGRLIPENLESHPPHKAYKDKNKMAAIVISCIKDDPHKKFILEGKITHNDRVYAITPNPDPSRHPRDTSQGHHEYILTIPDVYKSTDSSPIDSNYETLHREKRDIVDEDDRILHREKRDIVDNDDRILHREKRNIVDQDDGILHREKRDIVDEDDGILNRERRAFNPENYIIDIMVITDYTIYNEWYNRTQHPQSVQKRFEAIGNIRKYYIAAYNWVNLIYENFPAFDFTIQINVAALVISENATTSPWTESVRVGNKIYGMLTIAKMTEWINNNTEINPEYPEYDHVQLFSRFDFADDAELRTIANKGKSYIGSACTGSRSVSYVEELGGFNSADIAAHELGHSFGANHDGFGNLCKVTSTDLMAIVFNPRIARSNKPSICTLRDIKKFMEGMQDFTPECLYDPLTRESDIPTFKTYPGMEFGPDEQCRQVYGKESFYCRNADISDPNEFCFEDMFCYDPAEQSCSTIVAALGTPCGNKSWCIDTECRYDDRAPERDASCLFGDLPHGYFELTDSGESCAQRVISQPSDCYDDFFRSMCCESCARVRNNRVKDCPYGDQYQPCFTNKCGSDITIDDTQYVYNEVCCDTCVTTTVPTTSTTVTTSTTPLPTTSTTIATTSSTSSPSTTVKYTSTVTTTPSSTTSTVATTSSTTTSTVPTTSTTTISTVPTTSTIASSAVPTTSSTTRTTATGTTTAAGLATGTTATPSSGQTASRPSNTTGDCEGRQEYPAECQAMLKYGGDCLDFLDVCCETCGNYFNVEGGGSATVTLELSVIMLVITVLTAVC